MSTTKGPFQRVTLPLELEVVMAERDTELARKVARAMWRMEEGSIVLGSLCAIVDAMRDGFPGTFHGVSKRSLTAEVQRELASAMPGDPERRMWLNIPELRIWVRARRAVSA